MRAAIILLLIALAGTAQAASAPARAPAPAPVPAPVPVQAPIVIPSGALPLTPATAPEILSDQPSDYAVADHWLCRPDKSDSACVVNLEATIVGEHNFRIEHTAQPDNQPIDCFYVYPTVSTERGYFSDLVIEDAERDIAAGQAARFSTLCKVYAPMYRQVGLFGLSWAVGHGFSRDDRNWRDVRDAFKYYLAHDNHGRGIVLIGHSQGARMVIQLIKEFLDGKPEQKLLVSAIIAGNGNDEQGAGGVMTVAAGSDSGGTFAHVPLCMSDAQIGCVVAWSTYMDNYAGPRAYGNNDKAGHVAACVNPAALDAGSGSRAVRTVAYLHRAAAPVLAVGAETPFIKLDQQMSVTCEADGAGAVLRLHVESGPNASALQKYLDAHSYDARNIHMLDMALVQGNVLSLVRKQSARWQGK